MRLAGTSSDRPAGVICKMGGSGSTWTVVADVALATTTPAALISETTDVTAYVAGGSLSRAARAARSARTLGAASSVLATRALHT